MFSKVIKAATAAIILIVLETFSLWKERDMLQSAKAVFSDDLQTYPAQYGGNRSSQNAENAEQKMAKRIIINDFQELGNQTSSATKRTKQPHHNHCFFMASMLYGNMSDARHYAALHWYQDATVRSNIAAQHFLEQEYANDTSIRFHVESLLVARDRFLADPLPDDMNTSAIPFTRLDSSSTGKHMQRQVQEKKCTTLSVMRIDADDVILPGYLNDIWKAYQNQCAGVHGNVSDVGNNCVQLSGMHRFYRFTAFKGTHQDFLEGRTFERKSNYTTGKVFTNNSNFHCHLWTETRRFILSAGITGTLSVLAWKQHFNGDQSVAFGRHTRIQQILRGKVKGTGLQLKEHIPELSTVWTSTTLSGHFKGWNMDKVPCNMKEVEGRLQVDYNRKEVMELLGNLLYHAPSLSKKEMDENLFLK